MSEADPKSSTNEISPEEPNTSSQLGEPSYSPFRSPSIPGFVPRTLDVIAVIVNQFTTWVNGFLLLGLLAAAALALGFTILDQLQSAFPAFAQVAQVAMLRISDFVVDMLLVLILLEIVNAINHALQEREVTIRPFLLIGILAAVRGIFSIDAHIAASGVHTSAGDWQASFLGIGANVAVILAAGFTIRLLSSFLDEGASPRGRRRRIPGATTPSISSETDNDDYSLSGDGLEDLE